LKISFQRKSGTETLSDIASKIRRVLLAGITVAILDGLYVVVVFAVILDATTAERIFQGIARALLGQSASSGGWGTAAFGMFLHSMVAMGWSSVWAIIYENSRSLRQRVVNVRPALVVGASYGVFVWAAMRYAVLPLTKAVTGPLMSRGTALVLLAHILVVGPPIVMIYRHREMED